MREEFREGDIVWWNSHYPAYLILKVSLGDSIQYMVSTSVWYMADALAFKDDGTVGNKSGSSKQWHRLCLYTSGGEHPVSIIGHAAEIFGDDWRSVLGLSNG